MHHHARSIAAVLLAIPLAAAPLAARTANLDPGAALGNPAEIHLISSRSAVIEGRRRDLRDETSGIETIERTCEERVCQGRYFDGSRLYALDYNDVASPLDAAPPVERSIAAVVGFAFTSPQFLAHGGTIARVSPTELRVAALDSPPVDVKLDPLTALPASVAHDGRVVVTFDDYRRVGSLRLPFLVRFGDRSVRYDERRVASGPLAPPRGLKPRFENAGALRFSGVLPVVPCSLNGTPLRCLLDSGSGGMGIGLKSAERLRLEPFGEFDLTGLGSYATALVEAGPLAVGGAVIASARFAVVTDLPPGADIILGSDFFAASRIRLDYPQHQVSIAPPNAARLDRGVAVTYAAARPQVAATLDDVATQLVIDTGDDAAINLSYAFFRNHSELVAMHGRAHARGIGGASDVLTGVLGRLAVGGFRLSNVPVVVTRRSRDASGRIGSELLRGLIVTFDLPQDRVSFESPAARAQ